jgi:hypothetical protein
MAPSLLGSPALYQGLLTSDFTTVVRSSHRKASPVILPTQLGPALNKSPLLTAHGHIAR